MDDQLMNEQARPKASREAARRLQAVMLKLTSDIRDDGPDPDNYDDAIEVDPE